MSENLEFWNMEILFCPSLDFVCMENKNSVNTYDLCTIIGPAKLEWQGS